MIRMPAHKNTINPPGQVQIKEDKTLKDYIERKTAEPKKKLTFDEWWNQRTGDSAWWAQFEDETGEFSDFAFAEFVWTAAQENK